MTSRIPSGLDTHTITRSQFIPHTVAEVFPFFRSPENLRTITPPWLNFNIVSPVPIDMREGTTIDYTIAWLGIPVRWQTLIQRYDPPHEFVDIQIRGPYAFWEHTHRFTAVEKGTEMTDVVRYALPFGPFGSLIHTLFIRGQLRRIFDYRAAVLSRLFSSQPLSITGESR